MTAATFKLPPNGPLLIGLALGALYLASRPARASILPTSTRGYGLPTTTGATPATTLSGLASGLFSKVTDAMGKTVNGFPIIGGQSPMDPTTGSAVGVPGEDARAAVRAGDSYYGAGDAGNNDTAQEAFRRSELASYDTTATNLSPDASAPTYSDPFWGDE